MFDKTLNIDISGKSIRKKKGYPADTSTPLALSLLGHSRYVRHDLKYRLYPANLSGLTLPDIRPNQLIVPDCTVFAGGNPDMYDTICIILKRYPDSTGYPAVSLY